MQKIAWLCKLCVAIYAFVSGYGITRQLKGTISLIDKYKKIIKYILRFLKRYWIVFFIFVPLGFALGKLGSFELKTFILSLMGISKSYNTEWWYVKQYVFMLVCAPVIDMLADRVAKRYRVAVVIILPLVYVILATITTGIANTIIIHSILLYTIVFTMGILISKYQLFEEMSAKVQDKYGLIIGCMGIVLVIFIRMLWSKAAWYAYLDVILAPVFVYSFCIISESQPKVINGALSKLGEYSIYMWLTHTFYCYYYFQDFTYYTKYFLTVFLQLIIVTLATAFILRKFECIIDRLIDSTKERIKRWDR